jgi:RND family efflux transporter MFP subunit
MKQLNNLLIALVMLAATSFSCSNKSENATGAGNSEAVDDASKEMVKVMPLGNQEIARSIEILSTLEPFKEVHMAPSVTGKIEAINVEVGDHVKKGQVLVKMDDYQLIQSQLQLNNLQTDYSRMEALKKTNSIAQQQYDQTETQYRVAKRSAEYMDENTLLEAPFDGVISGKYFEPGEIYSGSPVSSVGKAAIVSIIQIDKLKAMIDISEKYFPDIKNGMKVNMRFDVYPDLNFEGAIYRIHPTIDSESRSFTVEVSVKNKNNMLRPGMFSRVTVDIAKAEAILLPAVAILKMQGSNVRYLFVEKNGKAKRVEVTLGDRFDDKVEVVSDELKVGDKVIISGQSRLVDGVDVQVVE